MHLQDGRKCIEEPPVTIELLLILLFHAKYNLRGDDAFVRVSELNVRIQSKRCGVFEQVCSNFFAIDCVLHMITGLIHAEKRQAIENSRMNFLASISYDADDNLYTARTFNGERSAK